MTTAGASDPTLFNSVIGNPWESRPQADRSRKPLAFKFSVQATTNASQLPPLPLAAAATRAFVPRGVYTRQAVGAEEVWHDESVLGLHGNSNWRWWCSPQ